MQYYWATKDRNWLKKFGLPLVSSIAEFWESRVIFNETEQLYNINQVIPPDEQAGNTPNNLFALVT